MEKIGPGFYPTLCTQQYNVTGDLPLSCFLGEAGGAGAEPPQNLPTAAAPVQTVLPLNWSGRKRGTGLSNPVPRFRRRNGNGKNPDGQGFKSRRFFAKQKILLVP